LSERQVVVGAAIIRGGRMLAARRRLPTSLAGGWEFPGGKVEPGESEPDALIRECAEELGIEVTCGARLPGEWPLGSAMLLRIYLAEIVTGEPQAGPDHDALRWLDRAHLFDVDWLPGDLAAVAQLRDNPALR
jgi:8-oxo-dGTP diphosphatase